MWIINFRSMKIPDYIYPGRSVSRVWINRHKKISFSGLFYSWYFRIKKFDHGDGLGTGVEFGKLAACANYQLSLVNLNESMSSEADTPGEKVKNRVFQISLAYMFGKK